VYTSSQNGDRFKRTVIQFSTTKKPKDTVTLKLDASQQFQEIFGFGGAFTDTVGINLNKLSDATKKTILTQYFSKDDGIGYTIGRVPMASCDFSTREYSYDDTDGDMDLKNFNLTEEDFTLKIPYILQASKLVAPEEGLKLFSTPWSAPGWMKTNGHMKGGGELKGDINGDYYITWANYFIKFFEEYAKNGINFWGTTIQNEPSSGLLPDYGWQTMAMTSDMELKFLGQILGPVLRNNSLTKDIKIMIFDDQREDVRLYSEKVLSDPDAAKYADGIAYHWYHDFAVSANVLSELHDAYPNYFMLPSEACTGYLPILSGVIMGDWSRGAQYAHSIIEDIQNYASGWTDWNICLDEQGGPNWVGNFVDSPIIISNTSDVYYKQPMFYALGHFSKFVRPGSYRIKLVNSDGNQPTTPFEAVGFSTPSSQRVVVLNNRVSDSYAVSIEDANRPGQTINLNLEGNSIITLVWNKA